jgi:hypothetical protein
MWNEIFNDEKTKEKIYNFFNAKFEDKVYVDIFIQLCEAVEEMKTIDNTGYDLHVGNVGFDKQGVLKMFDQRNEEFYRQ